MWRSTMPTPGAYQVAPDTSTSLGLARAAGLGGALADEGVDADGAHGPERRDIHRVLADHPAVGDVLEAVGPAVAGAVAGGIVDLDQLDLVADPNRRPQFGPLVAGGAAADQFAIVELHHVAVPVGQAHVDAAAAGRLDPFLHAVLESPLGHVDAPCRRRRRRLGFVGPGGPRNHRTQHGGVFLQCRPQGRRRREQACAIVVPVVDAAAARNGRQGARRHGRARERSHLDPSLSRKGL